MNAETGYLRRVLLCQTVSLLKHPFDVQTIAHQRIIHKYMGDRADQTSVLNDGAAAHALHNTTGFFDQLLIHDPDHEGFLRSLLLTGDFHDFNIVGLHAAPVHGGENLGAACMHAAPPAHRQPGRIQRACNALGAAVHAV